MGPVSRMRALASIVALMLACLLPVSASAADRPWIAVNAAGDGFVQMPAGASFTPWGFNYSRDERFRLIEDY